MAIAAMTGRGPGRPGARRAGRRPRAIVVLVLASLIAVTPAAPALAAPDVTARGAVLWEPETGAVLLDREATRGRPMASTTKIMTVLLALEAGTLEDTVTVSPAAADVGATPGGASLGLAVGDAVPMRSLLAGLLLRSGNGAAVAVAEHVAGSEAAFVERMNARAAALGLEDTHFVNSTGLTDDPAHRASPLDLARLAAEALARPDFAAWAAAATLDDEFFGQLVNRNELLTALPGATGVKTGFTSLAGLCLVASASRDGRTLIAVVLDSEDSFADAAALLEHGFADFRVVAGHDEVAPAEYRWGDAAIALRPETELRETVAADSVVTRRVTLLPVARRPLEPGTVLGDVTLLVDGRAVGSSALAAAGAVAAPAPDGPDEAAGLAVQEALRTLVRLRPIDHRP